MIYINSIVRLVVGVANRNQKASNLDGTVGCVKPFELEPIVSATCGREISEFGTVRPRVQIPGPRPKILFRIETLPASPTPPCHRGGHRFSRNSAAAAPVQMDCVRRLNSLTRIAQPIYQQAHGPGTVRHLGSKIKGAVDAGVQPTHKPGP